MFYTRCEIQAIWDKNIIICGRICCPRTTIRRLRRNDSVVQADRSMDLWITDFDLIWKFIYLFWVTYSESKDWRTKTPQIWKSIGRDTFLLSLSIVMHLLRCGFSAELHNANIYFALQHFELEWTVHDMTVVVGRPTNGIITGDVSYSLTGTCKFIKTCFEQQTNIITIIIFSLMFHFNCIKVFCYSIIAFLDKYLKLKSRKKCI